MNMTFPIMFCFVAKLLDITLSIYIGVFSGHEGLTTQLELFFLFLKKEKDNVGEVNFSKFRIDLRIFEKKKSIFINFSLLVCVLTIDFILNLFIAISCEETRLRFIRLKLDQPAN